MSSSPDFAHVANDWLNEPVRVPALLKAPLGFSSAGTVQRISLIFALLREMGLDHRMGGHDQFGNPRPPLRMATKGMVLELVDPLAEVCAMRVVPIAKLPPNIVSGNVGGGQPRSFDLAAAAAIVMDLGWGHLPLKSDSPPSVMLALDDVAHICRQQLQRSVLKLLRRWEDRGWIEDGV